jgi:hypothetical protein
MTIDLSTLTGTVRFLGQMPNLASAANNAYLRMRLISCYSNKLILNGANINSTNPWFGLTKGLQYSTWHSYNYTATNANLQTKDIEGYYWLEIDVQQSFFPEEPNIWTNVTRELVKVLNTFNREAGGNAIEYQGNNENNEQIIYFT